MKVKKLGDLLDYIQPTKYIVSTEQYDDKNPTPVLTAGLKFILGYTDENEGIFDANKKSPIILFDDFTTSTQWVDFPFKVKSSACKILVPKDDTVNMKYLYYALKRVKVDTEVHKRYWISVFSEYEITLPSEEEQTKIVSVLDKINEILIKDNKQIELLNESINSYFNQMIKNSDRSNKLGDLIESYFSKKCGKEEYPILSITKEFGVILQEEKFKKRIASQDVSRYKVVPAGILIQGIHIDERNFGIQNVAPIGIVSPAYKLWKVKEELVIPEVVAFALRTDEMMDYIVSKFSGSVKRREHISNKDFLDATMNIPSIEVQNSFIQFKDKVCKEIEQIKQRISAFEYLLNQKLDEYFK